MHRPRHLHDWKKRDDGDTGAMAISETTSPSSEGRSDLDAAEAAVKFVERLSDDLRVPRRLRAVGIPESAIPQMAESAMKVTRLLVNNPRKITLEDAVAIYKSAH